MFDLMEALGFSAVLAAIELNLFDTLHTDRLTAEGLADKVDASPEGIALLLEALEPLGYVVKKNGVYGNTAMTTSWMRTGSPGSMIGLFHHIEDAIERWKHLGESIRGGKPAPALDHWFDRKPEAWTRYHAGMLSIAKTVGDTVISKIIIPSGARRLLDVGGSHGLYSIKLCRKYPNLHATIVDLPPSRATAEQAIAQHGMTDRVAFLEGNFLEDDINGTFDVIVLLNFIRIFTSDELTGLLAKSSDLLNKNGLIVIMDQFGQKRPSRFGKANHALLRLELFNLTQGRLYTFDDTIALVTQCGFTRPRAISLSRAGGLGIVTATKGP
jgi:hypothetical protein